MSREAGAEGSARARAKGWMGAVVALVTAAGGGCFFTARDEPSVPVCTPGDEEACYSGPPGTAGIGVCAEGRRYCLPDGSGFWLCAAEVLPSVETCGDWVDNDCNGVKDDVAGCLVDRGLVTRHFIDEATSGKAPSQLYDAAPDPLDLDIEHDDDIYFVANGSDYTGLRWPFESSAGRASQSIYGTKLLNRVNGSKALTFELVVSMVDVESSNDRFIVGLGGLRLGLVYGTIRFYECNGYGCYARASADSGS
ncbi:MAG TPA: hypothetical protein VLS89_02555, partial [Candidatus Nanopelagicales bacterium]|nr:hypothetical protein [Candidatus Nanopelagicales bacterium]